MIMIKNWKSFNENYERLTYADIQDIEELAEEGMSAADIAIEMDHKDYITEDDVQRVINNMVSESIEHLDTNYILAKIREMYSKDDVKALLDKEKKEWSDSIEEYNSNNNGEAEDVVLDYIIDSFEKKYHFVDNKEKSQIEEEVKKAYSL